MSRGLTVTAVSVFEMLLPSQNKKVNSRRKGCALYGCVKEAWFSQAALPPTTTGLSSTRAMAIGIGTITTTTTIAAASGSVSFSQTHII